MKKFLSIFILSAYLIPAIGIGVNLHWCGNILFSFSMSSDDHTTCMCEPFKTAKDASASDCCKDDYVYYKLSLQHTSAPVFTMKQFGQFMDVSLMNKIPLISFSNDQQQVDFYPDSIYKKDRRPPDLSELSVFRV